MTVRLAFDTLCTSKNFTNCPVIFFLFKMIGILNRIRKPKIFLKYINLLWDIRCKQIKCMLVKNNSINFPDKFFALFWLVLEITKKMNIKGLQLTGRRSLLAHSVGAPTRAVGVPWWNDRKVGAATPSTQQLLSFLRCIHSGADQRVWYNWDLERVYL